MMTQLAIKPTEDVDAIESRNSKKSKNLEDTCSTPEVSDLSSWDESEHEDFSELF